MNITGLDSWCQRCKDLPAIILSVFIHIWLYGAIYWKKFGASPAITVVLVRETIVAPGNEATSNRESMNQRHGLPL